MISDAASTTITVIDHELEEFSVNLLNGHLCIKAFTLHVT